MTSSSFCRIADLPPPSSHLQKRSFADALHNTVCERIHTSSLIKIEKILNRRVTKFYNSDDVNVMAAELRLTKTRPTSLYKRDNIL